jgi:hypothetical protein
MIFQMLYQLPVNQLTLVEALNLLVMYRFQVITVVFSE